MRSSKKTMKIIMISMAYLLGQPMNASIPKEEVHRHKEPPIKVPDGIDGTKYGINGREIKKLIFILNRVEDLLHGVLNHETKLRTGKYWFKGAWHSIASLAEYEEANPDLNKTEKDELSVILIQAKKDFIKIATPFVEQARGAKEITIKFMEQWAKKHDKMHSHVLSWSKEKDGKEFETFDKDISNFARFAEFCKDLSSFTSDLIQSCPRAWKQFLALQAEKKPN